MSFFSNNKNVDYLSWKSLSILQKYISRFWEFKPRKYTWNGVSAQKKLRSVIIRARELGVLSYIK
jgi:ribosomal protein S18